METELVFLTDSFALYATFLALATCMFLMAFFGIKSGWDRWRIPSLAVFFIAAVTVGYFSMGELLSRPKPVDIMTWDRPDVESAKVEGMYTVHGKGIYLLLMYEGLRVPRYFQYPWNEEMAQKLRQARAGEAMGENRGVELKNPFPRFQHSWEDRKFPEVHEIPHPAPPPKDQQDRREIINLDEFKA